MSSSPESRTVRNQLGALLARRAMPLPELAAFCGLPEARLAALAAHPRLVPTPLEAQLLCLSLGARVEELLAFDLGTATRGDVLGELLGGGRPLQVTVCGAGNLGHVFAGLLSAWPELRVHLLTSSEEKATLLRTRAREGGGIEVKRREGSVVGMPHLITADAAQAVRGSQLVLLCLPSHAEPEVLARVVPHLEEDALLGSVPGPGGFQWAAQAALQRAGRRATVFGLASIPWMCKLETPGRSVRVLGTKTVTGLAAVPPAEAPRVLDVMATLLGFPVMDLQNFLQVILNPGNQLLHPGIMYARWADWDGRPVPEAPLFYEGLEERAASVLQAMSDEVQALKGALCARLPRADLSAVMPIDIAIFAAYGADIADTSSLRALISTNGAYAGIRTPMLAADGGFVPNWGSRFFLEDIPYGLVVLRGLADLVGVRTPTLDEVTVWAQGRMGREYLVDGRLTGRDVSASGAPQAHGLSTPEALLPAGL